VNSILRLSIELAGIGGIAALGIWGIVYLVRSRRKSPEELERLRRLEINRRGRLASGQILDLIEPDAARKLLLYQYEVAGISYEVAQDISALPALASHAHSLPGQTASVKYDPQRPTNSIVACEEWSGVSIDDATRDSGLGARERPALAAPPAPSTQPLLL
jgi:hypothetical protein